MTAKEYLQQYGEALRLAQRLRTEYTKEAELLDSIRSPLGSDGQPHGTGVSSPSEAKAVRLAEKLTEYQEAEAEALSIKRQVLRTINKVKGDPGAVLYERYINLKTWSQIADELHFSDRQCYRLRNEGLDIVDEIIIKMS